MKCGIIDQCRERWVQALSIDPETGLDPPGFKIRAAQGLDAAVCLFRIHLYPRLLNSCHVVRVHPRLLDLAEGWRKPRYRGIWHQLYGHGRLWLAIGILQPWNPRCLLYKAQEQNWDAPLAQQAKGCTLFSFVSKVITKCDGPLKYLLQDGWNSSSRE